MPSFGRFGAGCALLYGIGGLLYAVSFVVISRSAPALGGLLSALFLTLNGLLASAALAALYTQLRAAEPDWARWAFALGLVGALGSAIHGGHDLANAINPPPGAATDLPNQVDPRGLLTFGVSGIATLAFAWLIGRAPAFPRGLGALGFLLGVLLVWIYLARLTVLSPAHPALLAPVLLAGFIVNPAWYLWLGITLWRQNAAL
jgi:hypothetical protein